MYIRSFGGNFSKRLKHTDFCSKRVATGVLTDPTTRTVVAEVLSVRDSAVPAQEMASSPLCPAVALEMQTSRGRKNKTDRYHAPSLLTRLTLSAANSDDCTI